MTGAPSSRRADTRESESCWARWTSGRSAIARVARVAGPGVPCSRRRLAAWSGSRLTLYTSDVGEIPISLALVKTVAHDKMVGNREADVVDEHVDLPPRRLVEEAGCPERPGLSRAQHLPKICQRGAGIDDVLDDDDVAAGKRHVEILEEANLARADRPIRVTRQRDEVERDVTRNLAHEIRDEHERTLEDGHE